MHAVHRAEPVVDDAAGLMARGVDDCLAFLVAHLAEVRLLRVCPFLCPAESVPPLTSVGLLVQVWVCWCALYLAEAPVSCWGVWKGRCEGCLGPCTECAAGLAAPRNGMRAELWRMLLSSPLLTICLSAYFTFTRCAGLLAQERIANPDVRSMPVQTVWVLMQEEVGAAHAVMTHDESLWISNEQVVYACTRGGAPERQEGPLANRGWQSGIPQRPGRRLFLPPTDSLNETWDGGHEVMPTSWRPTPLHAPRLPAGVAGGAGEPPALP